MFFSIHMVLTYETTKTFRITDPEDPTKTVELEMTIGQFLQYKQNKAIIGMMARQLR